MILFVILREVFQYLNYDIIIPIKMTNSVILHVTIVYILFCIERTGSLIFSSVDRNVLRITGSVEKPF